jgi:hypothetical protein
MASVAPTHAPVSPPHDEGRGDACHHLALIVRRAMPSLDLALMGAPARLLYRHRLRQIPWLIDVTASRDCCVVGEELQRNTDQQRTEYL